MMVVPIDTEPTFNHGTPQFLFDAGHLMVTTVLGPRAFDISPDGQRFLMVTESEAPLGTGADINVVLNWTQELLERVPVP